MRRLIGFCFMLVVGVSCNQSGTKDMDSTTAAGFWQAFQQASEARDKEALADMCTFPMMNLLFEVKGQDLSELSREDFLNNFDAFWQACINEGIQGATPEESQSDGNSFSVDIAINPAGNSAIGGGTATFAIGKSEDVFKITALYCAGGCVCE